MTAKLSANILLSICAAVLTILALELALQVLYPAHNHWKAYKQPDAELGWVLEADARYTRQVSGAFVQVTYNRDGYRDDDFGRPVPDDATRVVVLGDSFMEANMVPLQDVFHKQLQRLAAKENRTLVAYNLGVAGYGTLQELLALRSSGKKLKPDLVLLGFFPHNDIRNNTFALNVAAADKYGRRKRPYAVQSRDGNWVFLKPDFPLLQKAYLKQKNSLVRRLRNRSVLATMVNEAIDSFETPAEYFRQGSTLLVHECTLSPHYETGWKTTEFLFRLLKKEVEALGARLFVFSVPSISEADSGLGSRLSKSARAFGLELCIEDSPAYRRLRQILDSNGIPYLDLLPDFRRAVSDEGRELFAQGDWHWNSAGHALAARRVYDALKSQELLPD